MITAIVSPYSEKTKLKKSMTQTGFDAFSATEGGGLDDLLERVPSFLASHFQGRKLSEWMCY